LINIFKLEVTARPRSGQKERGFRGRNFCPPAGFGWRVGVRLPKATAQVRIQCRDFVQNRFEFCPKDTASGLSSASSERYFYYFVFLA